MNENFINFHVLISHSPSCLNRDDMNMQKTAFFGGKRRIRISSQSLKRSMRTGEYFSKNIGEMSIRTKRLSELRDDVADKLGEQVDRDLLIETLELMSGKTIGEEPKIENDSVAPWAIEEIKWLCNEVKRYKEEGRDPKSLSKDLKKDITAMRASLEKGLDIALFGRMATSGLITEVGKIDGALAVAHAITTHEVDSDLDWFTAVDDLQELGSGHLNTQEFSSGVFYRFASLNIKQLQENLGGAERKHILKIASHVIHMLATEVPTAKQQSFAAFNLADMAFVSISDQPISLANAFEKVVKDKKGEGLMDASLKEYHDYWQKIHSGYSIKERCAEFCTSSVSLNNTTDTISRFDTLEGLKNWLCSDGE